jgi:hypothetical protein
MILFDDVVGVFDLTALDARLSFGVVANGRRCIGISVVDCDFLGRAVPLHRFAQEAQRGLAIPLGGEQEINRGTSLVDSPIGEFPGNPLTLGLVHSPAGPTASLRIRNSCFNSGTHSSTQRFSVSIGTETEL